VTSAPPIFNGVFLTMLAATLHRVQIGHLWIERGVMVTVNVIMTMTAL
jgi:hypothetical protein